MSTPVFDKTYYGFSREKGRVVSCSVAGFQNNLIALKMTTQDTPNIQMDLSLNSDTYLLDFGEKLSPLTVSGIVPVSKGCNLNTIKNVLNDLYTKHRLGASPTKIVVGTDTYTAYVTGKSTSVSSESPEIINFAISFLGFKNGAGAGLGGVDLGSATDALATPNLSVKTQSIASTSVTKTIAQMEHDNALLIAIEEGRTA